VLDLPTGFPTSVAHTFANAFAAMADPFACMLETMAAVAAAVAPNRRSCSRPDNKRKPDQNRKQNL